MKLCLVQHGEAKAEAEDPQRPLTEKGKVEVEKVAGVAKKLGVKPSHIFHSGKLRAEQTAKIIASVLEISRKPEAVSGLNPNDDVQPWAMKISERKEDLMLVGHLPFMGRLASLLLSGSEDAGIVQFRYGAIVCLEREMEGTWRLQWILTPELV